MDRLLGELRLRYVTGALTVADVGRARSALASGSLLASEDHRRAWLVACLKGGSATAAPDVPESLRGWGCPRRAPTESELLDWLNHPKRGSYRRAAQIAVACGWDGARELATEQTKFRVSYSRLHLQFEGGEPDDSDE